MHINNKLPHLTSAWSHALRFFATPSSALGVCWSQRFRFLSGFAPAAAGKTPDDIFFWIASRTSFYCSKMTYVYTCTKKINKMIVLSGCIYTLYILWYIQRLVDGIVKKQYTLFSGTLLIAFYCIFTVHFLTQTLILYMYIYVPLPFAELVPTWLLCTS